MVYGIWVYRVRGVGFMGFRVLGYGFWVMDFGFWVMSLGLGVLGV